MEQMPPVENSKWFSESSYVILVSVCAGCLLCGVRAVCSVFVYALTSF